MFGVWDSIGDCNSPSTKSAELVLPDSRSYEVLKGKAGVSAESKMLGLN